MFPGCRWMYTQRPADLITHTQVLAPTKHCLRLMLPIGDACSVSCWLCILFVRWPIERGQWGSCDHAWAPTWGFLNRKMRKPRASVAHLFAKDFYILLFTPASHDVCFIFFPSNAQSCWNMLKLWLLKRPVPWVHPRYKSMAVPQTMQMGSRFCMLRRRLYTEWAPASNCSHSLFGPTKAWKLSRKDEANGQNTAANATLM